MAELLFMDLGSKHIARRVNNDPECDYLVTFENKKDGLNTFAVQLNSTERPPGKRFQLKRQAFERLAHSNIPALLLVADVKQTQMHYAWLTSNIRSGKGTVSIPLVELNDATKADLKTQFESLGRAVAVAG